MKERIYVVESKLVGRIRIIWNLNKRGKTFSHIGSEYRAMNTAMILGFDKAGKSSQTQLREPQILNSEFIYYLIHFRFFKKERN